LLYVLKTEHHVLNKIHQLLVAVFLRLLLPLFGRWFFPKSPLEQVEPFVIAVVHD
jgi:hypothetical protein